MKADKKKDKKSNLKGVSGKDAKLGKFPITEQGCKLRDAAVLKRQMQINPDGTVCLMGEHFDRYNYGR